MIKNSIVLLISLFLIVLGLITFPLPIPTGLPLMFVGLTILFRYYPGARVKFMDYAKKNPRLAKLVDKFEKS